MPARIASLDDFVGGVFSNENASQNALFGKTAKLQLHVCHIPHLPNAKQCRSLLERIYKEFYPIMEKRGYNVSSLSEMCCCGDGLDHNNQRKGRRTLKIMGPQVGGYNMTTRGGGRRYGTKSHSIHLRLRSAQDHSIVLSYEEVAGVMAHEMAHCVHGPHNAAFYKLMDEILDQHAVCMAKGIVADEQGFPIHSSQAYTLGGNSTHNAKSARMQAALRRRRQQQLWMPSGPQKLGGSSQFQDLLPPGQAAAQAAYERRLRDEVWCQPCTDDDDYVIELSSDSQDEENDEGDCKPAAKQNEKEQDDDDDRKPAAAVSVTTDGSDKENATAEPKMATQIDGSDCLHSKPPPAAASRPASVVTIDLTTSDDEDDFSTTATTTTTRGRGTKKRRRAESSTTTTFAEWSCSRCTFRNVAGTLVCGMCGKESRVAQERSQRKVVEICKRDEILHVKEAEVQESIREFGFNIYGSDKQATAKLPHIT
jgi:hypothetical protein